MSCADDYDGLDWENHIFAEIKRTVWNGRDTVWRGLHCHYRVRDMEEFHIRNCLNREYLNPRWRELFEEELKIRAKEAFG